MQFKVLSLFTAIALGSLAVGKPALNARQTEECLIGTLTVAGVPTTINTCGATGSGDCVASDTSSSFSFGLPDLPGLGSAASFSVAIGACSG